jgi:hypothetical protein
MRKKMITTTRNPTGRDDKEPFLGRAADSGRRDSSTGRCWRAFLFFLDGIVGGSHLTLLKWTIGKHHAKVKPEGSLLLRSSCSRYLVEASVPPGEKMKARHARLLTILVSMPTLGCFTYTPVELGSVPDGTRVRAHLTSAGEAAYRERTEMGNGTINGTLQERVGNNVVFLVRSVIGSSQQASIDDLYQRVDIPRQDIQRVELKKVNTTSTGMMVAAGAGAFGLVLYQVLKPEPTIRSTHEPDPGPDENIRAPLFMVRLFLPHLW